MHEGLLLRLQAVGPCCHMQAMHPWRREGGQEGPDRWPTDERANERRRRRVLAGCVPAVGPALRVFGSGLLRNRLPLLCAPPVTTSSGGRPACRLSSQITRGCHPAAIRPLLNTTNALYCVQLPCARCLRLQHTCSSSRHACMKPAARHRTSQSRGGWKMNPRTHASHHHIFPVRQV